jgi:hypothetical protein
MGSGELSFETPACQDMSLGAEKLNRVFRIGSCRIMAGKESNGTCMKNAVFWDVVSSKSYVNRHFGKKYRLHLQGRKIRKQGTSMSQVAAGCKVCISAIVLYLPIVLNWVNV